jgi:thiamine biosynthesis protein ThiS
MNIIVNGAEHRHAGTGRLADLLDELKAVPGQVAIMVNERIIPKDQREGVRLAEGDRVEIITFMGGG